MMITQHFGLSEFESHDGEPYPAAWIDERLRPLCAVLEALRVRLGAPITILSGYRSPAHNLAVGGAQHSQHMEGRAADITVADVEPTAVHAALLDLADQGRIEIGGLGLYPSWVHVDVRPRPSDGHLARWTGSGVGSEVA
jgi:uncharacterized protein YcbK (DUF882 family)